MEWPPGADSHFTRCQCKWTAPRIGRSAINTEVLQRSVFNLCLTIATYIYMNEEI